MANKLIRLHNDERLAIKNIINSLDEVDLRYNINKEGDNVKVIKNLLKRSELTK